MACPKAASISDELSTNGLHLSDEERAEALIKTLEFFHREGYQKDVPMYAIIYIAHVSYKFAHQFLAFQGVHFKKGGWFIIPHWRAEDPYHQRLAKIFRPGVC